MKRKELKNIAEQIAMAEKIIQESDDKEAKKQAQNKIYKLAAKVHSLDDLALLDEYVQDFLNETT